MQSKKPLNCTQREGQGRAQLAYKSTCLHVAVLETEYNPSQVQGNREATPYLQFALLHKVFVICFAGFPTTHPVLHAWARVSLARNGTVPTFPLTRLNRNIYIRQAIIIDHT